jgi:hypothetical protein
MFFQTSPVFISFVIDKDVSHGWITVTIMMKEMLACSLTKRKKGSNQLVVNRPRHVSLINMCVPLLGGMYLFELIFINSYLTVVTFRGISSKLMRFSYLHRVRLRNQQTKQAGLEAAL